MHVLFRANLDLLLNASDAKIWQNLKRFLGGFLSSTNPDIVRSEMFY